MKILGLIVLLLFITVIIVLYHRFMQEQYKEEVRREFEKRYERDLEFRWMNQNVRIHSKFVIVDETKGKMKGV